MLDLSDPDFLADPYPTFAALRREHPVVWHEPTGLWLVFRHADANAVLRTRALGRIWRDREPLDRFEPFNVLHRHALLELEPPDHTRVRRLANAAFTRGHVERLRPRVQAIADQLLDPLHETDEFGLITDYAAELPVIVIAELLGVPPADRTPLRPWSNAIVRMYEYDRPAAVEQAAIDACRAFDAYLRDLIAERRRRPDDDLLSDLARSTDAGDRLTEEELVATAILLLNAGHEATVNVLGNGLNALLRRPGEVARLRADPALVEPAVEELIRFDMPLQLFERTATADVVIGGRKIAAGQKVAALLGAANRDPTVFPDPDRLDVARHPNPHVGFGAGIHFCLGAPLARVELQTSLATLLRRFPRMELAAEPVLRPNFVLRGYEDVRVRVR